LAQKLAGNGNLIVAKMDGNANEFDGLDLQAFPTFYLLKGGLVGQQKLASKVKFTGTKNVSAMIEFLKNSTHHPISSVIILQNETEIEEEERIDEETENFEQEEENNFNKSPGEEEDEDDIDWEKEVSDKFPGQDINNLNIDELTGEMNKKEDQHTNEEFKDTVNLLNDSKETLIQKEEEINNNKNGKEASGETKHDDL
jgi:hypothetical protein